MGQAIKLIVGLGNPGPQYQNTRHNAGAWFVESLTQQLHTQLKASTKFFGLHQKINLHGHDCHLLIPTTFMNHSGRAVAAVCHYYDILPQEVLVAHDELDLPPGKLKLKLDGGHGGHNGLKDIMSALDSQQFYRLRIGIGHPGHRDKVLDFVLNPANKHDKQLIDESITKAIDCVETMINGHIAKAMQILHTE